MSGALSSFEATSAAEPDIIGRRFGAGVSGLDAISSLGFGTACGAGCSINSDSPVKTSVSDASNSKSGGGCAFMSGAAGATAAAGVAGGLATAG